MSEYLIEIALALFTLTFCLCVYLAVKEEERIQRETQEIIDDFQDYLKTGNDTPRKLRKESGK